MRTTLSVAAIALTLALAGCGGHAHVTSSRLQLIREKCHNLAVAGVLTQADQGSCVRCTLPGGVYAYDTAVAPGHWTCYTRPSS